MKTLFKSALISITLSCVAHAEPYKLASETSIEARVAASKERLLKTTGGQLIWESIEAHGGLDQWFSNGLLEFRWTYHMRDRGAKVDSTQIIDTWSSRAIHTSHGKAEGTKFGWDGHEAWVSNSEAPLMVPPHFWSLTPYYFVGVPHVLADPGTVHQKLDQTITFEGVTYDQVKVTYESNTGESPDDYYIVLIHPKTKQVRGVRYIVTHPIMTKGATAFPEKLLTYENWNEIDGVLFPSSHRSFKMNEGTIGEHFRDAKVSNASFLGEKDIHFSKPK